MSLKSIGTTVAVAGMAMMLAGNVAAQNAKLGHLAPTDDPRHEVLEAFATTVAERTNGEVQIDIFPGSTLGSERELFEQAQAGITEFALVGSIVANFYSAWSIIDMPFLWTDSGHLAEFMSSEWADRWSADMAERLNVELIGYLQRNPRILTSATKPVRTVEDLRGMKVRVPDINVYTDTWRAFGVEPVPMPAADFYLGLRLGTIDAMENPVEVMYHWNIYEVSTYLTLTNHLHSGFFFIASRRFMDTLSDENRAIVHEAAREAEILMAERNDEGAASLFDQLRTRGMEIIDDPDLAGFTAASVAVHEKYMDQFGREAYEAARAMAD